MKKEEVRRLVGELMTYSERTLMAAGTDRYNYCLGKRKNAENSLVAALTTEDKPAPKSVVMTKAVFRAQLCWLRDRVTPCAQDRIFDLVLASHERLRELLATMVRANDEDEYSIVKGVMGEIRAVVRERG